MGAHPYWYLVPYRDDAQSALDDLRTREHAAGRYHPVISFLRFSEPAFSAQHPGPRHKSIRAAVKAAAEDGTRSILDIDAIARSPAPGKAVQVHPLRLRQVYGTDKPTREDLEAGDISELVPRGHCVYFTVFANDLPAELYFFGYSYD